MRDQIRSIALDVIGAHGQHPRGDRVSYVSSDRMTDAGLASMHPTAPK